MSTNSSYLTQRLAGRAGTSSPDAIPLSYIKDPDTASSSSNVSKVTKDDRLTLTCTKVKGLPEAILRSYNVIIHPLHEQAGIINNLRLPWLSNYKQLGEEYQDCIDHSAELAYGELALLNYLIDTALDEESDRYVRSFVRDMGAEISKFRSKLNSLQSSLEMLWNTISVSSEEDDPIQSAINQVKVRASKLSENQKSTGIVVAIRSQPDLVDTLDKIHLHWKDHQAYFDSRIRAPNPILSSLNIAQDRDQRASTQDYITGIHSTIKEHSMYFTKTNLFVKNLSSRAVSRLQKESVPLPPFCKSQFMETIGAPIFAHAAKQLKHLTKQLETKISAELISVKYLPGGKYRIAVDVNVASQQVTGVAESRCNSLQVSLQFDHVSHRGGTQLFRPHVVDCQPRTGKFDSEDVRRTLSSHVGGQTPFIKVDKSLGAKDEYTMTHGLAIECIKHNTDDGGVASEVTWITNEDKYQDTKYNGIPGIPLSVDIQPDDSHQILVSVQIKATFALRCKLLPWVYIPATREIEVKERDKYINLAVWSIKECHSERPKEVCMQLDVVKDVTKYESRS